jgi:hypothetical protein
MIPSRHLMDPWRDALIAELRLRDVPGDRIGEALAEVDAFCDDSGQTPPEAFGDPITYAKSLIEIHAPAPTHPVRRWWPPTARAFATVTGVFALLDGVDGVVHTGRAELTAGQLATVVLGTVLFPFVAAAVFSPALFHRRRAWAAVVVVTPWLTAVPVIVWPTPMAHAPAWLVLTAGVFLLTAAWWPVASDRLLADRIIDPRTGSEPFTRPRLLTAAIRWLLPAVLLIAVLLTALIP